MKVVSIEQGTQEWHDWRKEGLGASDVPAVMGESPYKTPLRLAREKLGLAQPEDLSNNPHIKRGNDNEAAARQAYDERHGDMTMPVCGEDELRPWRRVSFDGITASGRVLEIKCPVPSKAKRALVWVGESDSREANRSDLEALGLYYWGQVQYQLGVSGRQLAILWVWDVDTQQGAAIVIKADPAYQAVMFEKVDAFWALLLKGETPDPDPVRDVVSVSETAAEERYLNLETEIKSLEARLKALKTAQAEAQEEMVAAMGDFAKAEFPYGTTVTTYLRRGSVDYRAAFEDVAPDFPEGELERYRREGTTQVRITVVKGFKVKAA